jgi:hypothetical protein
MTKAVRVVSPDPQGWSGWLNAKSGGIPGLVRVDRVVGAVKNFWTVIARCFPTAVVPSCRLHDEPFPELSTCPDHPDHSDQPSISAAFQRPQLGLLNQSTRTTRTTSERWGGNLYTAAVEE